MRRASGDLYFIYSFLLTLMEIKLEESCEGLSGIRAMAKLFTR
jgi:hypothetical protein